MTPHNLALTAGFAFIAGVFVLPLIDEAYWSHIVMGCLAGLAVVVVGAVRRGKHWDPRNYA